MKGTINLHDKWGWGVINHTDESVPDWIPLHPDDLTHFAEMKEKFDNFEARVLSSPEVEFETIIHPKFTGRIIYAKLNTKEEPKQETVNMNKNTHYVDFSNPNADKISSASTTTIKQETLEKAAHEYFKRGQLGLEKAADTEKAFLRGAKWQAERMHSEEDLLNAFEAGMMFIGEDKGSFREWFEQFKKK